MTHNEKIEWMKAYASRHDVKLELQGECGFGRECVGILVDGIYPDFESWDDGDWDKNNGDVWKPVDAYHKHPCVTVLGRGENAESQLYEWLKWFDDNGFSVDQGDVEGSFHPIEIMRGKNKYARMIKND